jgi:hypothetical protein
MRAPCHVEVQLCLTLHEVHHVALLAASHITTHKAEGHDNVLPLLATLKVACRMVRAPTARCQLRSNNASHTAVACCCC